MVYKGFGDVFLKSWYVSDCESATSWKVLQPTIFVNI